MFHKVKSFFGGAEPQDIQDIRPEEIPHLLSLHEKEEEEEFAASAAESRKKILKIRDHLALAVQDLSGSEREAAFHPKLEKIAKNSLPQFEKAILSALNRQWPDSPDAFYVACTESLKGCVKGLAGPGRYLKNVLPEEMKAIRVLVDEFGREINALTPRVAEWRRKKEGATVLRKTYVQTMEMESSLEELSREIPALDAEIADLRIAQGKCTHEKDEMERALAADRMFQDSKSVTAQSEQALREVEREAHAVFSTLVHVFRKAEKIAHRPGTEKLARELNQVASMISQGDIPPENEVVQNLKMVLPVIISMIGSGEIQLKNQEERTLFANPEEIPASVSVLIKQRMQAEENVRVMEGRIASHPAVVRLECIGGELKSFDAALKEKEKRRSELEQIRQETLEGLPSRYRHMEQQISAILGKNCRITPR